MHLLAAHDDIITERLHDGPQNATYTSPEIQNLLLHIMASAVRQNICNAIQSAGYFSILADESKDLSKKEQMSIVLRYVDVSSGCVNEHFLAFVEAAALTADGLTSTILTTLSSHQLNVKKLVSQGYDGALS